MNRDELRESFRRDIKRIDPHIPDAVLEPLVSELTADADQYAAHLI